MEKRRVLMAREQSARLYRVRIDRSKREEEKLVYQCK